MPALTPRSRPAARETHRAIRSRLTVLGVAGGFLPGGDPTMPTMSPGRRDGASSGGVAPDRTWPEAEPPDPPDDGSPDDGTRPGRAERPRPGWASAWLGGRWVVSRSAVAGALAVALLAAGLVGALIWRSRPQPVTVPPLSAAGPPAAGGPSGGDRLPGGAATPPPTPPVADLVVAVVGKVRRPGLVTVPAGSRLVDALRAAGGALPGVDITSLNQARRVVDGEQIVVGAPAGAGTGTSDAPGVPPGPVNLNTATLQQLDELPGVGPVLAQRILDWRDEHAGFRSVDQLREISGIGDRTFERLRTKVTV